jgi:Arc/MetJ-type ribon-helix-helix transcriptional regulator
MPGMSRKISVSLPDADVQYLDHQVSVGYYESRSAGLHAALARVREDELTEEYQTAFEEWRNAKDAELWDGTVADGLEIHATR